jgi:putative FmdB family regulatory protein
LWGNIYEIAPSVLFFICKSGDVLLFIGAKQEMPIYEYECTSCCNVFEIFQRLTEDPLMTCPDCSGPVKKLVSMSSFQLKGGGWYADGYSSKSCSGSGSTATCASTKNISEKAEKAEKAEKKKDSSTDSSAATKSRKSCSAAT